MEITVKRNKYQTLLRVKEDFKLVATMSGREFKDLNTIPAEYARRQGNGTHAPLSDDEILVVKGDRSGYVTVTRDESSDILTSHSTIPIGRRGPMELYTILRGRRKACPNPQLTLWILFYYIP
jgi:hypothetical protein